MFKGDDWGSTFFFVDYDYADKDDRDAKVWGATGSYFEIARSLNFWQESALGALSAHVEFNAGIGFGSRNWLFGAEYFLHNADFSNTFTFELLFKTFNDPRTTSDLPLQFTFVWGMNNLLGVEGLKFSGFADIWGENTPYWYGPGQDDPLAEEGKFVFISEPQLWYNVGQFFNCPNFSVGTEVELGFNFAGCKGFTCNPCVGAKWDF